MQWVERGPLCTSLVPTGLLHPCCGSSAGAVAIGWGGSAKWRLGRWASWSSLFHSHSAVWPKEYKTILLLYFFCFFSSGAWSYTAIVQLLLSFTSFYEVFSDSVLVNMLLLRENVCISWSSTWLCYPTPFLLPTLLLVVSVCDLIQFTNIGENYQWRGSTRPFHSFSNSETRDQFSFLRELQMEPLGTWSCTEVDSKIPPDVGAAGAVSGLQSCMWLHGTAQA